MNLDDTCCHNRAAQRNRHGPYAEAAELQNKQHTSPSDDPPHIGSRSLLVGNGGWRTGTCVIIGQSPSRSVSEVAYYPG